MSSEGRIEVWYDGTWGTVCDDDWDDLDATVVCLQLGYLQGTALIKAHFNQGQDPILMDNVYCRGNETSLLTCHHNGWGKHNCQHTEDSSVRCQISTSGIYGYLIMGNMYHKMSHMLR